MDNEEDSQPAGPTHLDFDDNPETFTISEQLFETLREKGFSENAIKKSIISGCIDESTCTAWITMHAGHEELNTPVTGGIVNIVKKKFLTEEEKAEKVNELREKIRLKKLEEEEEKKKAQHRKELERIDFGRNAIEAERRRKELLKQQELREKERDREIDAIAKRNVKLRLKADKLVRGGMSEVEAYTTAEAQLKAEEAAQKEKEEKAKLVTPPATAPIPLQEISAHLFTFKAPLDAETVLKEIYDEPPLELSQALELCKALQIGDSLEVKAALPVLTKIIANILHNPLENKLRILKPSSSTFSSKLLPSKDALRILRFCNFDLSADQEGNTVLLNNTVVLRKLEKLIICFG